MPDQILHRSKRFAKGYVLLEALIGMLIFSLGVLGLIAFQAAASKSVSDSRYRTEAAMYADKLLAQMSADKDSSFTTNYASPSGSKFTPWLNGTVKLLPNGSAAVTPSSVLQGDGVTVMPDQYKVAVTINWQAPGGASGTYSVTSFVF